MNTKQTTITLPARFVARLEKHAAKLEIPMAAVLAQIAQSACGEEWIDEPGLLACDYVYPSRAAAERVARRFIDEPVFECRFRERGKVVSAVFRGRRCVDEMKARGMAFDGIVLDSEAA